MANAMTSGTYVLSVTRPREEQGVKLGGPSFAVSPLGDVLAETTEPVVVVEIQHAIVEHSFLIKVEELEVGWRTRIFSRHEHRGACVSAEWDLVFGQLWRLQWTYGCRYGLCVQRDFVRRQLRGSQVQSSKLRWLRNRLRSGLFQWSMRGELPGTDNELFGRLCEFDQRFPSLWFLWHAVRVRLCLRSINLRVRYHGDPLF
jgi:hypothetical protein